MVRYENSPVYSVRYLLEQCIFCQQWPEHHLAVVRNRLAVAHLYLLVGGDTLSAVCLYEFAAIAHRHRFVVALDKDVGLPTACVPANPPLDPPSLCYPLNKPVDLLMVCV